MLAKRLAVPVVVFAAVTFAAAAHGDPTSGRIRFFACVAGAPTAKAVPADTPLYVSNGWTEGNYGLLRAQLGKIVNTFSITYPDGRTMSIDARFQPIVANADGTWTAPFQVDLGSLQSGESLTIHWTGLLTGPLEEIIPPSDAWDPTANFQPPWDGTGLKYQKHDAAGPFDNGTCTVTAS